MGSWTKRRVMLVLLALPASVAIWAGWVALGRMCGFGKVELLPGIADWEIDTSITLPIGMEAYAAYALGVALDPDTPEAARSFARWSSWGALISGMAGQAAYHTMTAWGWATAPTQVVVVVACIPVVVLGMGARLMHLTSRRTPEADTGLTALIEATSEAEATPPASSFVQNTGAATHEAGTLLYLPLPARHEAEDASCASLAEADEADRKAEARRLVAEGRSAASVATQLEIDKSTVYRWTKDIRDKKEAR